MPYRLHLAFSGLVLAAITCLADEPSPHVRRDFLVEVDLVSYVPGGSIESYGAHGSGSTISGSRLGLGTKIGDQRLSVEFHPYVEDDRFLLEVGVSPESYGRRFEPFDMTKLRPIAINLGADEEGRVFQANVAPRVRVTDSTPRVFKAADMRLHYWTFPNCAILLNDLQYVGRIHCGRSPVGFVEICGSARVEFSLLEVEEWEAWGTLNNGTLTLTHPTDRQTVQIAGVRNGRDQLELPGGPYRVWVKWSDSGTSVEAYREKLRSLREEYTEDDLVKNKAAIANLDQLLAREPGPWAFTTGVRGYQAKETVVE